MKFDLRCRRWIAAAAWVLIAGLAPADNLTAPSGSRIVRGGFGSIGGTAQSPAGEQLRGRFDPFDAWYSQAGNASSVTGGFFFVRQTASPRKLWMLYE